MDKLTGGSIDKEQLAEFTANLIINAVKGEVKAPIQMETQVVTDRDQMETLTSGSIDKDKLAEATANLIISTIRKGTEKLPVQMENREATDDKNAK